jgi:hypothetical protein
MPFDRKKIGQRKSKLFEESLAIPTEVPSIEQLLKFLMARFQTLQAVMANNKKAKMPPQKSWEKRGTPI